MALEYWYDHQFARIQTQFLRIFSGFQYETGIGRTGTKQLLRVPNKLAFTDRMVATIVRNNSENVMLATPQITAYVSGIEMDPQRRQNTRFVGKIVADERAIDPTTGEYTNEPGTLVTVERLMPVPYLMKFTVDIWTSNMDQKLQLLEQILVLFNPALDLQFTTNPIDWTSLTVAELTDITWSSRTIPIGTANEIEVSTLIFKVPVWITPPAKVIQTRLINEIIMNIGEGQLYDNFVDETGGSDGLDLTSLYTTVITTPGDFHIQVSGNVITLVNPDGTNTDLNGNPLLWADLLAQYGKYRAGVSQIRLKTNDDLHDYSSDIIGIITISDIDPNQVIWQPDIETLPQSTIPPVNAIINPHETYPGKGLPPAAVGQRYLLLDDINATIPDVGTPTVAWGDCVASSQDIIEWNGMHWVVVFNSAITTQIQYVLNLYTGKQLKWDTNVPAPEVGIWHLSIDGEYAQGFWKIFI